MKKQTSRNNMFLAETKRIFNHLIYKKVLSLVNEDKQVEAKEYLKKFCSLEWDEKKGKFFTSLGKSI